MSADDEIRRALSGSTPPVTAPTALRELGPSMRRARARRRVAVSATAAALIISGGAGVFALTAHRGQTTLRTVTSEGSDHRLPIVTEVLVSSTSTPTTVAAPEEPPTLIEPPTTAIPTSAPADEADEAPTRDAETRSVDDGPPATPIPAETPTAPTPAPAPPAPAPVPASFQTITSACGDVVVSIDAGTVQIVTITARPGFDHQVADDGPNSIEVTFTGDGDEKCEVHAELKPSGLDVEVQNAETER